MTLILNITNKLPCQQNVQLFKNNLKVIHEASEQKTKLCIQDWTIDNGINWLRLKPTFVQGGLPEGVYDAITIPDLTLNYRPVCLDLTDEETKISESVVVDERTPLFIHTISDQAKFIRNLFYQMPKRVIYLLGRDCCYYIQLEDVEPIVAVADAEEKKKSNVHATKNTFDSNIKIKKEFNEEQTITQVEKHRLEKQAQRRQQEQEEEETQRCVEAERMRKVEEMKIIQEQRRKVEEEKAKILEEIQRVEQEEEEKEEEEQGDEEEDEGEEEEEATNGMEGTEMQPTEGLSTGQKRKYQEDGDEEEQSTYDLDFEFEMDMKCSEHNSRPVATKKPRLRYSNKTLRFVSASPPPPEEDDVEEDSPDNDEGEGEEEEEQQQEDNSFSSLDHDTPSFVSVENLRSHLPPSFFELSSREDQGVFSSIPTPVGILQDQDNGSIKTFIAIVRNMMKEEFKKQKEMEKIQEEKNELQEEVNVLRKEKKQLQEEKKNIQEEANRHREENEQLQEEKKELQEETNHLRQEGDKLLEEGKKLVREIQDLTLLLQTQFHNDIAQRKFKYNQGPIVEKLIQKEEPCEETYTTEEIMAMSVLHTCMHADMNDKSHKDLPDPLGLRQDDHFMLKHFKLWIPGSSMALNCYRQGCFDGRKRKINETLVKSYLDGDKCYKFENTTDMKSARENFLRRCGYPTPSSSDSSNLHIKINHVRHTH